jgi:hypothetical protein
MTTNRFKSGIARAAALTPEERHRAAKKAAEARWGRKATHKGSFLVELGVDADCYVLDDELGTAVVTQNGLARILGFRGARAGATLSRFLQKKSMLDHLGVDALEKINNPFKFQYINRGVDNTENPLFSAFGYDATVIVDICNAIVSASTTDNLIRKQQVACASVILGACAKLGIRELIYKLAGYNSTKAQVIAAFRQYVMEEASKWAKEFPDELYAQWQRIYKIPAPVRGRNWEHRHLTVKYIYYPLARSNGILLQLLREAKGDQKSKRLHQFLDQIGKDALRAQIWKVVGIASGCETIEQYEKMTAKAFGGQLPLEFQAILEES